MANTITVILSDGSKITGTMSEIRERQKELVSAAVGFQRHSLREQSKEAHDAAYATAMDLFYEQFSAGAEIPVEAIQEASANAGRLASIAAKGPYYAAGYLDCPNAESCGGVRKPRFTVCAPCDGKA